MSVPEHQGCSISMLTEGGIAELVHHKQIFVVIQPLTIAITIEEPNNHRIVGVAPVSYYFSMDA